MIGNKGQGITLDAVVWGFAAFGLAIVIVIAWYVGNTSINAMGERPIINSSVSTMTALRGGQAAFSKFDYYFFGFFIGTVLAIIVGGWMVSTHPILMGIYFLILCVGTLASAIASNVWYELYHNATIGAVTHFPITNHIMSHLPVYVAAIGMIGLIVMFAKPYMVNQL